MSLNTGLQIIINLHILNLEALGQKPYILPLALSLYITIMLILTFWSLQ